MRKYLSIVILGLSLTSIQAQDIADALRFSQENLIGTARFRAMGGAFGAVGGDFQQLMLTLQVQQFLPIIKLDLP